MEIKNRYYYVINKISNNTIDNLKTVMDNIKNSDAIDINLELSEEHLHKMLNLTNHLEYYLRSVIYEITSSRAFYNYDFRTIDVDSKIKISYEDNILRVFTPLTLTRNRKNSYSISDYVNSALKKYRQDNNIKFLYKFKPPLSVYIVRYVHKFNSRLVDNDNIETHAIVNAIFNQLCLSDKPEVLRSVTSAVKLVGENEDEGVEFVVLAFNEATLP